MSAAIEADRVRHQQEVEQLRTELTEQKKNNQAATAECDKVRAELVTVMANAEAAAQEARRVAERMTNAEADRDAARKEGSAAREEAAKLRGQVEALHTQAADQLRALAMRQTLDEGGAKPLAKSAKGKKGD